MMKSPIFFGKYGIIMGRSCAGTFWAGKCNLWLDVIFGKVSCGWGFGGDRVVLIVGSVWGGSRTTLVIGFALGSGVSEVKLPLNLDFWGFLGGLIWDFL